jgi:hypothetical protein
MKGKVMKHSLIKTAFGAGLLAVSLGASAADLKSFADAMVFYQATGTGLTYVALIPSGNQTSDSVLLLQLDQSPTTGVGTSWNYGISGAALNANSGGKVWSFSLGRGTASNGDTFSFVSADGNGVGTTVSSDTKSGAGSNYSYSWYGGDAPSTTLSMQFLETLKYSSVPCLLTYTALLNADGYLEFPSASMSAKASLTNTYYWDTSSTGTVAIAAADTTAISDIDIKYNSAASMDPASAVYKTSGASVSGNSTSNVSAVLASANRCQTVLQNKYNLGSGVLIGGGLGMTRIW